MRVFISHALEDKSAFDNIADALEREGIPYWDPSSLVPGALLADQLRAAIKECAACIFVATARAVESSWCGAELGAFWGADKPVLIFVADSELDNRVLPRQFHGHFFEKRISKLVESVRAYLVPPNQQAGTPRRLAELDETELRVLIGATLENLYEQTQAKAFSASVVADLAAMLETDVSAEPHGAARAQKLLSDTALLDRLRFTLQSLLGATQSAIKSAVGKTWWHQMQIRTSTGLWHMYSLHENVYAAGDVSVYSPCLLLRYSEVDRLITAAIVPTVTDNDIDHVQRGVTISEPAVIVGRGVLGKPLK